MASLCNNTVLWDSQLVWFGSWPQFSECFQTTVLAWLPCAWLWLTSPFYIYYLNTVTQMRPASIWSYYTRLFICSSLALLSVVEIVEEATKEDSSQFASLYIAPIIKTLTFLFSAFILYLERRKGFITSGVQFIFWLLVTVTGIVPFYTKIKLQENQSNLFRFSLFYVNYFLVLAGLVLSCVAEKPPPAPPDKRPCPEEASSFLSRLTFWWINQMLLTGYRKTLTEKDIHDLHPREKTSSPLNMPSFEYHWNKQVLKSKESSKNRNFYRSVSITRSKEGRLKYDESTEHTPLLSKESVDTDSEETQPEIKASIVRALWDTVWLALLPANFWKLIYDLLTLVNPLLLGELIRFTEDKEAPVWKGYTLGAILFSSMLTQSLNYHATWHQFTSVSLRMRTVLVSAIYRKSLTLNNQAKREATVGEIVNLMSVDCENVKRMVQMLWGLWSSPLQILLSLVLLYNTVGLPMFAGLGVLVLIVPFNYVMLNKWQAAQRTLMKLKDERMKIVSEVLNGIKILKLYAWEPPFEEKIMVVREKELRELWKLSLVQACVIFSWNMTPYLVSLATLLTYIYTTPDHYLSPQTAFVAVSLLNVLRFAVVALPDLMSFVVQAHVSLKRISKFLTSEDLDEDNVHYNPNQDYAVTIDNGTFLWNKKLGPTLRNINLNIKPGQLVAVVGQVGAGKSSLISAMFGEMEKVEGRVELKGNFAYVPQEAWIQNDTLKNNILFGTTLDEDKYQKVIDSCALKPDLDILPAGDLTEIGERGINLSGGQKQRVSLARAVYNDADVYLLDDPLSAVDSHVGKHIFDQVVCNDGLLANKTRVLVTHGIHWLPRVDTIIVITNGQVSEMGSYDELLEHDGAFAQFLHTYLLSTKEDEDPEDAEIKRQVLQRLESVRSEESSDGETLKQATKPITPTESKTITFQRAKSITEEQPVKGKEKLIKEEKVEEGKVAWNIYGVYIRSFGIVLFVVSLLIYAVFQAGSIGSNIWLSQWTDNPDLNNLTILPANSSVRLSKNNFYVSIYGTLGLVQAICILTFSALVGIRGVHSSRILHNDMLETVLRAPMSFFDTTPTGRIVNRFSQDINAIDVQLPHLVKFGCYALFESVSSIIVISYSTPIFLTVVLPLGILYYFIQVFYINTARQLKRLESKTRSPIFSHFGETIAGTSVIRVFKAQSRFIKDSEKKLDENQKYAFYGFCAQRWLGFRLEFLGNIITLVATVLAVTLRDSLSGGIVGLSISYGLQITNNLNWVVRMASEIESQIVAVERVQEYSHLDTEASWDRPDSRPAPSWPQAGVVSFREYSTRYRKGLDLVLRGINCSLNSGEKVGVVGRTGAGKSSLTLSLFRLIEAAGGSINIDGADISSLGLHDLRRKLTILPQDPVLFAGTLRSNVDPFNQYSDHDIWTSLEHAHLKNFVETLPGTLEHECSEGGENMSVGQRQLLCLARALLKKTKILVLDEATAAVDMETDDLIQQTIRSEFKDCTVLTIAHRLNTIMDYDRVLVLDNGRILEFDSPSSLLQRSSSVFYSMAQSAGLVS